MHTRSQTERGARYPKTFAIERNSLLDYLRGRSIADILRIEFGRTCAVFVSRYDWLSFLLRSIAYFERTNFFDSRFHSIPIGTTR